MQSGKIVSLAKQQEVKGPLEYMKEAVLIEDIGIEGNVFQGGKRQVCVCSSETRKWMSEQVDVGLCFKHFSENILTEGIPLDKLQIGDLLSVGGAKLYVNEKKPCFDDCVLRVNKRPCQLSANAFFAVVKKGGVIKLEDSVFVVSD